MSHLLVNERHRTSGPQDPARRTNKACINCARIKCKCILRDGADGCERCHRLSKKCEPVATAEPQSRKRTRSSLSAGKSTSRSARLEAKLNDLVDLLKTSGTVGSLEALDVLQGGPGLSLLSAGDNNGPVSEATNTDPDNDVNNTRAACETSSHSDAYNMQSSGSATARSTTPCIPVTAHSDSAQPVPSDSTATPNSSDDGMLPHESEMCLRRFCDDMLPLVPIMHIPADMPARIFRDKYPFTWTCIKAAAALQPQQCIRAAAATRRAIIDQVVEGGQRSMDHLLGMLTFVTWVNLSAKDKLHRNFSTLVAQMAVTVAWDLGLPVPPLLEPSTRAQRFVPVVPVPGIPATLLKAERTMEERRAVLGVYLVTTVAANMFRSADGLRWSPYLDYCLSFVAENSTVPQDATLVRHVKMQLLINHVRYSLSIDQSINSACFTQQTGKDKGKDREKDNARKPAIPSIVSSAYTDSLQSQLDEIAGVVGGDSVYFDNFATHCLYHFAVLTIHETTLARPNPNATACMDVDERHEEQDRQRPHHPYQPYQPPWLVPNINMARVAIYKRCLASVKAWLDRFLAWPLPLYMCMPGGTYFQLFYVLVCLQKLSVVQDPAWDSDAVRSAVDLFPTLDRIIDMCHQLRAQHSHSSRQGKQGDEYDPLLISIRKFTTLKNIWLKEASARDQERDRNAQRQADSNTNSIVTVPAPEMANNADVVSRAANTTTTTNAGAGSSAGASMGLGLNFPLGYGLTGATAATSMNLSADTNTTENAHLGNIAGMGDRVADQVSAHDVPDVPDIAEPEYLFNTALSPNLFTSYSADAFNYFNAIPDLVSDIWF